MKILKFSLLILGLFAGAVLTVAGWQNAVALKKIRLIEESLIMKDFARAETEIKAASRSWYFRLVLSRTRSDDFYELSYYRGVVEANTGRFSEAQDSFSEASKSRNETLNDYAQLARSSSLMLAGNVNNQTVTDILSTLGKIISRTEQASWAKQKAMESAFWILAHTATEENISDLNGKKDGKNKQAIIEEFRRSLEKNMPAEGQ